MATVGLQRFRLDGIRDKDIEIGRGSYAVVKELDFRGLKCVGKEIHSLLYEEAAPGERADMLRRFEEECELLGRLNHPNVVQFLGVYMGTSSGLPSLVMEYLHATLSGCIDRHGVLSAEISLGILRDVALGLRYLHEHSPPIIHRDLSANNVLLTTSMSAKISDLGVAKILDMSPAHVALITQTQVPGTPSYMPPETMLARPKYTSKVDIFSLGVMMVHVLSGEWPMPSEGYAEDPQDPDNLVVVAEVDRRRDSVEKIEDGHPLLGLIRQCLSNIPSRRPDAVEVVHQVSEATPCPRVPPNPENRLLELLQRVQSLKAELHQSSTEENKALRRENETLQAELSIKTQEIDTLRRENAALETERRQISSKIEEKLSTKTQEVDSLRSTLQSERTQKDSVISSLRAEIERMRSEVAMAQDRYSTETESLRAEVQSSSLHERAAESEFPTGLSHRTRLRWRRGADAPDGTSGAQVVIGERVYVRGSDNRLYQYDWRRDSWSTLPDCPVFFCGMAQFLGKLITVGGKDKLQGSVTGKVFQFNFTAQQWEEFLPPMPTARCGLTVVARTSSSPKPSPAIVACGGSIAQSQPVTTVEVYSHVSSQWHTAKPLPIPIWTTTSVTINDTCYILGGRDSRNSTKHCFFASIDLLIDNATSSSPHSQLDDPIWMSVSNTPLTGSTAASLRGSLIAIGGYDQSTRTTSPAIYILTNDGTWERVRGGDLPEPCHNLAAVCLPSGELLVAGGLDDGSGWKRTVFFASIANI